MVIRDNIAILKQKILDQIGPVFDGGISMKKFSASIPSLTHLMVPLCFQ